MDNKFAVLYTKVTTPKMQKIWLTVAVLLSFALIYILNRLYPLFAEDWDYRFVWEWGGTNTNKISSLGDIIQSQYNHYMRWGGRSVVHAIDQFLLMLGTGWNDLLNSLAFIAFVLIIYKTANRKRPANVFVLIFIVTALYLFQPAFPTTVLWLTGSCNYLWGTLIIMLFLYPYCAHYVNKSSNNSYIAAAGMVLLGILAGWTNENMGIALIILVFALLALYKKNKSGLPLWVITGLCGVIAGYVAMLIAPGNYFRLEYAREIETGAYGTLALLDIVTIRLTVLYKYFCNYMLLPSAIYLFLAVVYIRTTVKEKRGVALPLSLLFFCTAYIAHTAMVATPTYPERAIFGVISFIIIAIAILYANIELKKVSMQIINLVLIGILLFLSAAGYYRDYRYLRPVNEFWKKREAFVEQQKAKSVKDIVFEDKFDMFKKDFEIYDLVNYTDNWLNNAYARYHGVKTVRIE